MSKMNLINKGHKVKALCPKCDKVTAISFEYRPYLTEIGESIPDVLQGFCDVCGKRVLIPPQSIPKISPFYVSQNITQEYKIPRIIEDVLLNIGSHVKLEKPDAFKTILRYYLLNESKKHWIKIFETKDLGPLKVRISVRIDQQTDGLLKSLVDKLGINKNQFITLMLWDAKDRLLENNACAKEFLEETKLLRPPGLKAA